MAEIHNFTGLLAVMGRIRLVEQGQMELGFLEYITAFRREPRPAGATADCSAVDLLRYCSSRGAQSLLQLVFCLGGGVQSTSNATWEGIGHLSSDVMSCICAVISGYLSASHVRSYGSVSEPTLEEVMEPHRRLVDLAEITEDMMWDDVGIVAEKIILSNCMPVLATMLPRSGLPVPRLENDFLTVCVDCCLL